METSRLIEKIAILNSRKLNTGNIWLLFLLLGWSYGSMNQMTKQIFYYLTLGGLGLWILYRLFTLSSEIKAYNKNIAFDIGFEAPDMMRLGLS